jgi:hypothetical protein
MVEHFIEIPDHKIQIIRPSNSALFIPPYRAYTLVLPKNRSDPRVILQNMDPLYSDSIIIKG